MADGQGRRMAPYRETFWIMALSLMAPIAVALIILIAFKVLTLKGALLAGDVNAAHAGFELKCEACHDAWKGPTDQKCMQCHNPQLVRDHAPGWNLPGDHNTVKMLNCKHCHVDHHGRSADLRAQGSTDCILCHGFRTVGDTRTQPYPHPEVRMIQEHMFTALPQSGFRQFKHSDHVNLPLDRGDPKSHRLNCKDCHTFLPGDRILKPEGGTDVNFDRNCKQCHSDQLTWAPSRHAQAVTVTHGNIPPLEDNKDAGTTKHDAFLAWSSDQKCGQCHLVTEKVDPTNPQNVSLDVSKNVRLASEDTWVKLQHWGYGEFSHARHLDKSLSGAIHPLNCTDCHQSADQYQTFVSPSFNRQCVQCHAMDLQMRHGPTMTHPQVPQYADTTDKNELANNLSQARQWAGRDVTSGQPLPVDQESARHCAKCHSFRELPGAAGTTALNTLRNAYGAHYAGLEPLLAQASPDASSAAASPSAAPVTATPSTSASVAASPVAATPAASSSDSGSPAAAAPAASDTSSPAAAPGAAPVAAVAAPTPQDKLDAPIPLPEDVYKKMGNFYEVRAIVPVAGPVSQVTHFNHKPHITAYGNTDVNKTCVHCHQVNPAPNGQQSGTGLFDMQILPSIQVCASCHNSTATGVVNKCGTCHDFHDKTRRTTNVILSPQSNNTAPRTLTDRIRLGWSGR